LASPKVTSWRCKPRVARANTKSSRSATSKLVRARLRSRDTEPALRPIRVQGCVLQWTACGRFFTFRGERRHATKARYRYGAGYAVRPDRELGYGYAGPSRSRFPRRAFQPVAIAPCGPSRPCESWSGRWQPVSWACRARWACARRAWVLLFPAAATTYAPRGRGGI